MEDRCHCVIYRVGISQLFARGLLSIMVVRLTPDQKVGGSIPSGVIFVTFGSSRSYRQQCRDELYVLVIVIELLLGVSSKQISPYCVYRVTDALRIVRIKYPSGETLFDQDISSRTCSLP